MTINSGISASGARSVRTRRVRASRDCVRALASAGHALELLGDALEDGAEPEVLAVVAAGQHSGS